MSQKERMKFLIVSPRQHCGGPIVLHVLCKCLNELGYKASIIYASDMNYRKGYRVKFWIKYFLFTMYDIYKATKIKFFGEDRYANNKRYFGYVNEPIKGCHRRIWPFAKKDEIVVYPEIAFGNFTRAKNVVRWLLYFNKYQVEDYKKNDLFFTYSDAFNDVTLNPSNRKLHITYFDLDTYKRTNYGERSGTCYIVRKGAEREDLPKELDGVVIDKLSEKEKVKVFNSCEYCISYDLFTGYSAIAALCGCISIIVPEPNKTREDYSGNCLKYGVAYGFSEDEIKYAISTREMVLEDYKNRNASSIDAVKEFVDICNKYFNHQD